MTDDGSPEDRALAPARATTAARLPSLEPYLAADRLRARHVKAIMGALVSVYGGSERTSLLDDNHDLASLRSALAACPSPDTLTQVVDTFDAALAVPPDRRVNATAVAVLFDSRARHPVHPEVYLSALIYDLTDEEFPPCVVVAACQKLRREHTFTPEIAEVLAICRSLLAEFRATLSLANRAIAARAEAEERLIEMEADPPPPRWRRPS